MTVVNSFVTMLSPICFPNGIEFVNHALPFAGVARAWFVHPLQLEYAVVHFGDFLRFHVRDGGILLFPKCLHPIVFEFRHA